MHIVLQLESDFPQQKVNLTNTKPVCYEYSVTASGIPIPKSHSNESFTTILVMPIEKGTPGTATWIVLPKHTYYENSCCPACLDLQALDFKKCKANKLIIYSVGIHQLNPTNLLLECSAALLQHYLQIHMQVKITNQVCRYYAHQGSFLECKGKLPGQHLQICSGSARWPRTGKCSSIKGLHRAVQPVALSRSQYWNLYIVWELKNLKQQATPSRSKVQLCLDLKLYSVGAYTRQSKLLFRSVF